MLSIVRSYSLVTILAAITALQLGCGAGGAIRVDSGSPHAHQALPEQYIWFASASPDSSSPRFFRKSFVLGFVPAEATLYFVGPYNSDIFVNGTIVSRIQLGGPVLAHDRPVIVKDIAANIQIGSNEVALEVSAGDVLAIKIVPAGQGINSDALLLSDATWKGATAAPSGWEQPSFDDNSWKQVQSFGSVESDPHHFQGNFDLGMYQWPGYEGLNALLDHVPLEPVNTHNLGPNTLLLDFAKEISGRLEIASSSSKPMHLQLNFGESAGEATPEFSSLGTRDLIVPPFATVHGPLTAFRFAQINSTDELQTETLTHIRADQVLRKILRKGSFESSDPVINQIWETSVYTAQLGMQTTFWDAPKRDRNPFSGDLFVGARTAQVGFGNMEIIRDTLSDLLRRVSIVEASEIFSKDINGIPPYNAWWVLDLADQYRFSGDRAYLQANRDNLVEILNVMASELNHNLFDPNLTVPPPPFTSELIFADWSPGMVQFGNVKAPDAVEITTFSYYRAFVEGAFLLRQLGDITSATRFDQLASDIKSAAIATYLDSSTGTFADRLQTNAMAIFSGVADKNAASAIFNQILSQQLAQPVSPYFNYFVISAMAQTGHRTEALALIRKYWGSMLDAGATTFWEVYDPTCPTSPNFHACLTNFVNSIDNQGTDRFFVSLAHGWSSGPAPWLHEEILGIKALSPGFGAVQIRPELAGLQWARGTETTPEGIISIDIQSTATLVVLDKPAGTDAYISLPTNNQNPFVLVNGAQVIGNLVENKARTMIHLPPMPSTHFVLQSF